MINFLMKRVDPGRISPEITKAAVHVKEQCQNDHMSLVRDATFEALQIAKMIAGQNRSRHEIVSLRDGFYIKACLKK